MNNLRSSPPGRRGTVFVILNALLAIGFTVLSFRYVQPRDCYRACGELETSCPNGACRIGEQKAGWPLPVFVDSPGGGSPLGGWGILGPEDLPDPFAIFLDLLFYSLLVWLALYGIQAVRGQAPPLRLPAISLPLNILLAATLWLSYMVFSSTGFFGSYTYIGRGHWERMEMETPISGITSARAFAPTVSIPVSEMIEDFGEPDYVRFEPAGILETPPYHTTLFWDALRMSAELPKIRGTSYTVERTTQVELIVFYDEEQYLVFSGDLFAEDKMPWKGYGDYWP